MYYLKFKDNVPAHLNMYFNSYEEYQNMLSELQTCVIFDSVDWLERGLDIKDEFFLKIAEIQYFGLIDLIITKYMICNNAEHTMRYIYKSFEHLPKPKVMYRVGEVQPFLTLEKIKNRYLERSRK